MKDAQIRRQESVLAISGVAFIAFGAWSVLKTVLFYFSSRDEFDSNLMGMPSNDGTLSYRLLLSAIAFSLLFDLALRCYVGRAAIADARGTRHGVAYLVVAILLSLASVTGVVMFLLGYSDSLPGNPLIPGIIELTTMVVVLDLAISSLRLKYLRRRAAREG